MTSISGPQAPGKPASPAAPSEETQAGPPDRVDAGDVPPSSGPSRPAVPGFGEPNVVSPTAAGLSLPASQAKAQAPRSTLPECALVRVQEERLQRPSFLERVLDTLLEAITFGFAKTRTWDKIIDEDRWREVGCDMAQEGGDALLAYVKTVGPEAAIGKLRRELQAANPDTHPTRIERAAQRLHEGLAANLSRIDVLPELEPEASDRDQGYGFDVGAVTPGSDAEKIDATWGNSDGQLSELEASMAWAAHTLQELYGASVRLHTRSEKVKPEDVHAGEYVQVDARRLREAFLAPAERAGARVSMEAKMGLMLEMALPAYLEQISGREPSRATLAAVIAKTMARRRVPIWDYLSVVRAQGIPGAANEIDVARAAFVAEARRVGWTFPAEPPPAGINETSAPAFGTLGFEALLDKKTQSVARANNQVGVLLDGVNSFKKRLEMIEAAKETVHIQTFSLLDDETGRALAQLLLEKAKQGVKVRVIYEEVGSKGNEKLVALLRSHENIEVRSHRKRLGLFGCWHEKHVIVDGVHSVQGGMNIGDVYAFGGTNRKGHNRHGEECLPWRDVDAYIRGPAVGDTQRAFLRNWALLGSPVAETAPGLYPTPELSPDGAKVRVVQHLPEAGDDNTHQLMMQVIRSAKESVLIENAYFYPPAELRQALIAAAKRGVKVRILTNSERSTNHKMRAHMGRALYDEMLAAGVEIYERSGDETLHSKTLTADGRYSLIGSCNLNGRSRHWDTESVLAIESTKTARTLEDRFEGGTSPDEAHRVTLAEMRAEPFFWTDVRQWGLSLLDWLL